MQLFELARRLGAEVRNARSDTALASISLLDSATSDELSFLPDRRYAKRLYLTRAAAVLVDRRSAGKCTTAALIVENPLISLARAVKWVPINAGPTFSGRASGGSDIDPSARIHPSAHLSSGAVVGANTVIGAGSHLEAGVRIGDYCRLGSNVTLARFVTIGNRVSIDSGSCIGTQAFAYLRDNDRWLAVPMFGSVHIGDDVDIGANVTIARGVLQETLLDTGVKLDNQVQIGHDTQVGRDTAIAAHSAIAGAVNIGQACLIGGGVGIAEGVTLADGITVSGMSMVSRSLSRKKEFYASGWPARPSRQWWKFVAQVKKLI